MDKVHNGEEFWILDPRNKQTQYLYSYNLHSIKNSLPSYQDTKDIYHLIVLMIPIVALNKIFR